MITERDTALFSPLRRSSLGGRLGREFADAAGELARGPAGYLRAALPGRVEDWLPARLVRMIGFTASAFAAQPLRFIASTLSPDAFLTGVVYEPAGRVTEFVNGAVTPDTLGKKRRRRLLNPILIVSGLAHSVIIVYLAYLAIVAPYAHLRVVDKAYRKFDSTALLGSLRYPPGMLRRQSPTDETLSLEEIRERDRRRREERERRERDKAEREKAERERREKEEQERLAKERAAEEAKKQEATAQSSQSKFGEINEAPIKDIIRDLYALYKSGELQVENFTVEAKFKIKPDGSLSDIDITESSGSKLIDEKALDILWKIGESHALGPISVLTSNTIRLELNEKTTSLTIAGFAPTPDVAKNKADQLNGLIWLMKMAQKSAALELLSQMKVTNDNKRVIARMSMSRERAGEMMRAQFGGKP